MVIEIKKIARELKIKLPDLITRPAGKRMYEKVKELLRHAGEDEVTVLDFSGVKVLDASFVDELLIRLILDSREDEKTFFLKLTNVSDVTELNIDTVLNSHHLYNNEKIAVVTDGITFRNSCYLGVLSPEQRDILDYLRINKTAGPEEIVSYVSGNEENTIKEIEELYRMRMLRKSSGKGPVKYISI